MAEDNIKYKALISWIKHDEGIRKRVFDELFRQFVNLDLTVNGVYQKGSFTRAPNHKRCRVSSTSIGCILKTTLKEKH